MIPQWYAVDPDTGEATADLTKGREKTATWRLDAPCDAAFTIDGNPADGPDLTYQVDSLTKDLLILWDRASTFGMRCRVGASDWTIGGGHVEKWGAVDYRAIFARHYARTALSYTTTSRGDILRSLIDHARSGTNSTFNVTPGVIEDGGAMDLNVAVQKSLGEQADELAGIYPGFDMEVDADLQLHARTRGVLRDFVLEYPTTVTAVQRQFDPSVYGNSVIQTGTESQTPAVEDAADLGDRPEGRWEVVASNPDIPTQSALNATALQNLRRSAASGVSHTFTLKPGIWTPDVLWIGDLVPYRYESAARSVDGIDRVYEITVTDSGNGEPDVQVKVGNRLTTDMAALQRRIVMRLNQLARR